MKDISENQYHLRPRCHNRILTTKSSSIVEHDFTNEILLKDVYWQSLYLFAYMSSLFTHMNVCILLLFMNYSPSQSCEFCTFVIILPMCMVVVY